MRNLIYLITGARRERSTPLRSRWVLFKWIIQDSFLYLFVEDSPEKLEEIKDDLYRMEKMPWREV